MLAFVCHATIEPPVAIALNRGIAAIVIAVIMILATLREAESKRIIWNDFVVRATAADQPQWIFPVQRRSLHIAECIEPTQQTNGIALYVPPDARIVVAEVVVMLPGFLIVVLARQYSIGRPPIALSFPRTFAMAIAPARLPTVLVAQDVTS